MYDIDGLEEHTGRPHFLRDKQSSAVAVASEEGRKIDESIDVAKSPRELYVFFSDLSNLRLLTPFLEFSWSELEKTARFVIHSGRAIPIEWQAIILTHRPGRMIAWRTIDPSDIDSAGSIWFRPLPMGRGTTVRLIFKYDIPNEYIQRDLRKLLGEPLESYIRMGLRRLKVLLETDVGLRLT